mmetsp:Transcript_21432/g.31865  ORF Transcript_21432/g.31865 Transcript_21432/m.31865 type:complete len:585 (+) Transcript_21432:79-1833(+)
MLCTGGRRTSRSSDGKNPTAFRRATTSMATLKRITREIFNPSSADVKQALESPKVELKPSIDVPRSIRWHLGLSRSPITFASAKALMRERAKEREKYIKKVRDLEDNREKHEELWKLVTKDVIRTFQDMQYYRTEEAKSILTRILVVWVSTCGALGYRQGMNELLAVCHLVTRLDAATFTSASKTSSTSTCIDEKVEAVKGSEDWETTEIKETVGLKSRHAAIYSVLCSSKPADEEADTFTLFRLLMQQMSPLYHSHPRDGLTQVDIQRRPAMGIGSGNLKTPLDRRVHRVHHVMLRRIDPKLYFRLQSVGVLPQLYMLRWLRLLFAREAPLSELLVILDAMLGDPNGFELLDFMCLALVAGLRTELLEEDEEHLPIQVLLRRQTIRSGKALVSAARLLSQDKLLGMPAPAKMLVYNSPLQKNGARMVRSGKQIIMQRPPMEGYVVGVKSQTLYWCVLEGFRLDWFAEPTRGETVAQTWLNGCTILGHKKGVIEIQAPPKVSGEASKNTIRHSYSGDDDTKKGYNSEPNIISVKLAIKDPAQYDEWLERLIEAANYQTQRQNPWRQCLIKLSSSKPRRRRNVSH